MIHDNQFKILLFRGNHIRREVMNNKYVYSVIDIISSLTSVKDPQKYWSDLKSKLEKENNVILSKIKNFKYKTENETKSIDVIATKDVHGLVDTIDSPFSDNFKSWLLLIEFNELNDKTYNELIKSGLVVDIRKSGDPSFDRTIDSILKFKPKEKDKN